MTMSDPQEVEEKFSNLLAPRGIIGLPGDYEVHRVDLTKGDETGQLSGCSMGVVDPCPADFLPCGVAKTGEMCGVAMMKTHQNLCCPSVILGVETTSGIAIMSDL